jgi:hypothetical protein
MTSKAATRPPPSLGRRRWQTIQRTVSASRIRTWFSSSVENAEDAVDRLPGVDRMEGAQDEMPRLGGGQADLDRLPIPHFADEDHLRRLAERGPQSARKGIEIVPHLPLIEGGHLVGMGVLDRIFEGDDVDRLLFIDIIEERRERRRLAASRRTGHEDDPVLLLGHLVEGLGKVHLLEGRDPGLQLSQDDGVVPPLRENVHAEAGLARELVRGVARSLGKEGLRQPPVLVDQIQREDLRLEWGQFPEGRVQLHAGELARALHLKGFPHRDVQVRRVLVSIEHLAQNKIDFRFSHGLPP